MLDQLRIRNFALIQDWEVNIREGETVVTGETGSGKSLLVSAIQYLMGGDHRPGYASGPRPGPGS